MEPDEIRTEDDQDQVIDITDTPQYPQPSRTKKKKREEDLLVEVLTKKIAGRSNDTLSKDPDYMFLVSLLPEIKKIPETKKLFAKIQIMNTILNAQTNCNIVSMPGSSYQQIPNVPVYTTQGNFHNQYQASSFSMQPNMGPLQHPYQQQVSQHHNFNADVLTRAQTNTPPPVTSPSLLTRSPSVTANSTHSNDNDLTQMSSTSNDSEGFPYWSSAQ